MIYKMQKTKCLLKQLKVTLPLHNKFSVYAYQLLHAWNNNTITTVFLLQYRISGDGA